MPAQPSGNPNSRGSARLAVGEHDLQLTENHVPILAPGVPVLNDPLRCQIQHPTQGIVIGEQGLVLCDLPELPVQTFDNVRRVYDFPNLRRIFKEGMQIIDIAFDSGFSSISSFIRMFKQIKGCTPTEFRSLYYGTMKKKQQG